MHPDHFRSSRRGDQANLKIGPQFRGDRKNLKRASQVELFKTGKQANVDTHGKRSPIGNGGTAGPDCRLKIFPTTSTWVDADFRLK
jgi:hypothetical protein